VGERSARDGKAKEEKSGSQSVINKGCPSSRFLCGGAKELHVLKAEEMRGRNTGTGNDQKPGKRGHDTETA